MIKYLKSLLVSSHNTMSEFLNTSIARKVISSRLPIGVETMYNLLEDIFIMKKNFVIISYIILCFNSHLFSIEDNRNLKNWHWLHCLVNMQS